MLKNQGSLRRIQFIALLMILLALLIKGISMQLVTMNYVKPHWDTNYYLNIGSNYFVRGGLTPYMWRVPPDSHIIAGSGTGYGIFLLLFWFKLFGLTLQSGQMMMYLLGVISLPVCYGLVRIWWGDDLSAIGAVVFTALNTMFLMQFYIRMDAPATLAYSLILWLHLYAVRNQRRWLHSLLGVILILACEIHILTLVYIGAISFYYLVDHLRILYRERKNWAATPLLYYLAGLIPAGLAYIVVHILPNPAAYFLIAQECPLCEVRGLAKEWIRYRYLALVMPVETVVFVLAMGMAVIRRTPADQHYFLLTAGYALALGIISPPTTELYLSHLWPLAAIGAGGLLAAGSQATQAQRDDHSQAQAARRFFKIAVKGQYKIGLGLIIACIMLLLAARDLKAHFPLKPLDSTQIDYIQRYIPHDAVVMGRPPYFYLLLQYSNYVSYASGERYGIKLRGEDYMTFWERERPTVFLGGTPGKKALLRVYFKRHNFQEVRPGLWIDGDLLDEITRQYPAAAALTN